MEFKKLANNTINFGINRIIETLGLGIIIAGVLLLISLVSFSPDDPNFIFPDNTVIKNLLGFQGSFTSDLFFQSFGVISLLIPLSLIICGINIVLNKKILLIIIIHLFLGLNTQAEENIKIDIVWETKDKNHALDYKILGVYFENKDDFEDTPNYLPSNSGYWEEGLVY